MLFIQTMVAELHCLPITRICINDWMSAANQWLNWTLIHANILNFYLLSTNTMSNIWIEMSIQYFQYSNKLVSIFLHPHCFLYVALDKKRTENILFYYDWYGQPFSNKVIHQRKSNLSGLGFHSIKSTLTVKLSFFCTSECYKLHCNKLKTAQNLTMRNVFSCNFPWSLCLHIKSDFPD